MSFAPSRAVLRQSRLVSRRGFTVRQASTTTDAAASKAKETASKASEGLSKVASSAGPAISSAVSGAGSALMKVGGRTGKAIKFVDSLIPPTVYYTRVGIELSKLIFRGQKMTPPTLQTFQSYFAPLINSLKNPQTLVNSATSAVNAVKPNELISTVRNMDKKTWAVVGVTAAELIGFFSVGEMLGRFKVVGYRGEPAHGH